MIYHFKKTFIGVGGREYINNPKLSFPEHVKIRRRGTNPKSGQPYAEAGSAFVETSSIASRLCCSASAARQYLHRHGARFRVVRKGTGSLALYWRRADVDRILARREPVRRRVPPCYMDMAEAIDMLGVVRSYIYRLVKKGAAARIPVPDEDRPRPPGALFLSPGGPGAYQAARAPEKMMGPVSADAFLA